ncbi:MAG: hypothetical protein ACREND_05255 [Gemmatimonadaceae bacterium]
MRKSLSLPQAAPTTQDSLALACSLPADVRAARRVTAAAVVSRTRAVHQTETGVRLVFDGSSDTATMVVAFALAERECCSQFTYTIRFEPDGGLVELSMAAPDHLVAPLQHLYTDHRCDGTNA